MEQSVIELYRLTGILIRLRKSELFKCSDGFIDWYISEFHCLKAGMGGE